MSLTRVAMRVFNQVHAIEAKKLDVIIQQVIMPRLAGPDPAPDAVVIDAEKTDRKPYDVTTNGIAIISIAGPLVNKASWMDAWCGLTSYQQLNADLSRALDDGDVKGILLEIDSPGGEVSGLFDLADRVFAARGTKPIYASVSDSAFSAAYALASATDRIFVTRTAGVGSIGVVCCHVDQSNFDKKIGVKYTFIYAGKHKIDGNPHQPLSKDAQGTFQAEIDRIDDLFIETVARNRGLDEQAVRDTEASLFFGDDGITEGLADELGTLDDAEAALVAAIEQTTNSGASARRKSPDADASAPSSTQKENEMAKPTLPADAKTSAGKPAADDEDMKSKGADKNTDPDDEEDEDDDGDPEDEDDEEDEDEPKRGKKGKAKSKSGASDVDKLIARAQKRGYDAAAEVAGLCELAGLPGMAAELIRKKATPAEARTKLLAARAEAAGDPIDQNVMPDTGTRVPADPKKSGIVQKCQAIAERMNRKGAK